MCFDFLFFLSRWGDIGFPCRLLRCPSVVRFVFQSSFEGNVTVSGAFLRSRLAIEVRRSSTTACRFEVLLELPIAFSSLFLFPLFRPFKFWPPRSIVDLSPELRIFLTVMLGGPLSF